MPAAVRIRRRCCMYVGTYFAIERKTLLWPFWREVDCVIVGMRGHCGLSLEKAKEVARRVKDGTWQRPRPTTDDVWTVD